MLGCFEEPTGVNAASFGNNLQIEYCGVRQNASYIYADSSEILLGVVLNSTMIHNTLRINETCKQTHGCFDVHEVVETNTLETKFSTVTALPSHEKTITEEVIQLQGNCKFSEQNYYLLFTSVLTFVIGLVLKPDRLFEMVKIRLNEPDYAGNDFTRIRTRL